MSTTIISIITIMMTRSMIVIVLVALSAASTLGQVPPPSWPTDIAWQADLQFSVTLGGTEHLRGTGKYYFDPQYTGPSGKVTAAARIDVNLDGAQPGQPGYLQSTTMTDLGTTSNVSIHTWYNTGGNVVCETSWLPPFDNPFSGASWSSDGLYPVGLVNKYTGVRWAISDIPTEYWQDARTQNPVNQSVVHHYNATTSYRTEIIYTNHLQRFNGPWSQSVFSIATYPTCSPVSSLVHRAARVDSRPFTPDARLSYGDVKRMGDDLVQGVAAAAAASVIGNASEAADKVPGKSRVKVQHK